MSLEALFTSVHEVEFKGVTVKIKDVSMNDLPLITKLLSSFISGEGDTATKVTRLVMENLKDVQKLIASLTEFKESDIGKFSLDTSVFIISKIIENNIVFLKKNIVPTAQKLVEELNKTGSDLSKS